MLWRGARVGMSLEQTQRHVQELGIPLETLPPFLQERVVSTKPFSLDGMEFNATFNLENDQLISVALSSSEALSERQCGSGFEAFTTTLARETGVAWVNNPSGTEFSEIRSWTSDKHNVTLVIEHEAATLGACRLTLVYNEPPR